MIFFCIVAIMFFLSFQSIAESQPVSNVKTNKIIVSNTVNKKAWKRTALMASEGDKLIDPSGKVVSASDAEAVLVASEAADRISDGAIKASRNAMEALFSVTNQVYEKVVHISMGLPRTDQKNLTSWVESETSDESYDYQTVRFSHLLKTPPVRRVEYSYVSVNGIVSASVRSKWIGPWDETSFFHECRMERPSKFNKAKTVFRTERNDIIGGSEGFSFGHSSVRVDGLFAYTGAVTNLNDGTVLIFKNGVLKNE